MTTKTVDMHCDTISVLLEKELRADAKTECLRSNSMHLDLLRMKEAGYYLQNFALFVEANGQRDPWETYLALYHKYQQEMKANADLIRPVYSYDDILKNQQEGIMSAMLTVEEGAVIKGSMDKLEQIYDMGVRMMTLTWNYINEIGHPNTDRADDALKANPQCGYLPDVTRGLTPFGKEVAAHMQDLGMIVDVSHLSDAGFYDVLDCTRKPFVASHSNARAVCGHVRNMTDDMIRKLADRGGVMGLNFCSDFMETVPKGTYNPGSLKAAVDHAIHIARVGGIECLGMGSDFDGISTNEALSGVHDMPKLWEALHEAGFSEDQLDDIFYKNVFRVYKDCL